MNTGMCEPVLGLSAGLPKTFTNGLYDGFSGNAEPGIMFSS